MKTGHQVRRWLRRRKVDRELARELAARQPVRTVRRDRGHDSDPRCA